MKYNKIQNRQTKHPKNIYIYIDKNIPYTKDLVKKTDYRQKLQKKKMKVKYLILIVQLIMLH